jgi:hypothetical protein
MEGGRGKTPNVTTLRHIWETHAGPYYPLGTTGTVHRAYDIIRAYEGMEEEKIKIKKLKIGNCNTKFKFKK